eukprot:gene5978-1064_t
MQLGQETSHYTCATTWAWAFKSGLGEDAVAVGTCADMPLCPQELPRRNGSPVSSPTKATSRKGMFRAERAATGDDPPAVAWCTCSAFDPLSQKDAMCEVVLSAGGSELMPPTTLVSWDQESAPELPACWKCSCSVSQPHGVDTSGVAVLKPAIGSRGNGIEFVRTAAAALNRVTGDAARARQHPSPNVPCQQRSPHLKEPHFLDRIRDFHGRVPGWVLQTHVPSLLVSEGRKFHIRTYVVAMQGMLHGLHALSLSHPATSASNATSMLTHLPGPALLDLYLYPSHEVRVAAAPFSSDTSFQERDSHLTNGHGEGSTQRLLLAEVPEIADAAARVEDFVSRLMNTVRLAMDLHAAEAQSEMTDTKLPVRRMAVAGVDMMMDPCGRLWLLEFNPPPACPPPE